MSTINPSHLRRPWAAKISAKVSLVPGLVARLLRRSVPNERQQLFALTVVIGGACGLAAVAFHELIELVSHFAIDPALAAPGRSWIGWTLLVPTLGGLAAGLLLQYVVPNARGSGIPQVKVAFAGRGAPLRMRDSVGKFFVGALQIGTGSSLGREGPTVQITAGLASRIGRLAGLSADSVRRLLPVGAAAGIAAAFNAPIAAVTFTIEEVVGTLDQTVLSGVIVAAALAAIVERSILGTHPVFDIPAGAGLDHASSLLLYAALGLARRPDLHPLHRLPARPAPRLSRPEGVARLGEAGRRWARHRGPCRGRAGAAGDGGDHRGRLRNPGCGAGGEARGRSAPLPLPAQARGDRLLLLERWRGRHLRARTLHRRDAGRCGRGARRGAASSTGRRRWGPSPWSAWELSLPASSGRRSPRSSSSSR